jgi:cytochrome b subunit of formate dehydrogenase
MFFYIIISGFMMFPAGDFNILAQNIFEIWAKRSRKLQFFNTPWHTESRSNGADLQLVMRVHTGHHHDPIGYGLGLRVTKHAH